MNNIKLSETSLNILNEELKAKGITDNNIVVLNINENKNVKKTINDIETNIKLNESIDNILSKESNNTTGLIPFLNEYKNAINLGVGDEMLYEDFISGASSWSYLNAVDTELSALKDRISKYKENIDFKKILKIMEQTNSCYLVPILEDYVIDYVDNKNPNTRTLLKNTLMNYSYDPYVRNMIQIIDLDTSKENTMFLGESLNEIKNNVNIDKIYSPVQYIKENECIINVKGNYYSRKGNNIIKLSRNDVNSLNESFKNLCNVLNDNRVVIDEDNNSIMLYWDINNKAIINESNVILNNKLYSPENINVLYESSKYYDNNTESMYYYIKTLMENFNNIANIDFVKHISLKNSLNESVDLFRIKNNIFITTNNNKLGKHVFYRNVNSIQTSKIINEHLNLNISKIFEDLMPKPEKIKKEIKESKEEYESLINELEEKLNKLNSMNEDDSEDKDSLKEIKNVIKEELEKTKSEYKKYCEQTKKFLEADGEDSDDYDTNDFDFDDSSDDSDDFSDDKSDDNIVDVTISSDNTDNLSEPITGDDEYDFDYNAKEYDPNMVYSDNGNFVDTENLNSDEAYQIVKVLFDENVKTSTKYPRGSVYVLIPMINPNGDKVTELNKVTFTISDDGWIVVNNEYMPEAMYNQIVAAIKSSPDYSTIETPTPENTPELSMDNDSDTLIDDTLTMDDNDIEPFDNEDSNLTDDSVIDENSVNDVKLISIPIRDIYNIRPLVLMKDLKTLLNINNRYNSEKDTLEITLRSNEDIVKLKKYLLNKNIFTLDQLIEKFPELNESFKRMNEGMELKITDDKTGKKYTIDLSNISGDKESDSESKDDKDSDDKESDDEKTDDKESDDADVTFDEKDSILYNPDEDDDSKDDKKTDEKNESENVMDKPKKPKFKFKIKKNLGEVHSIHESLNPQVLDKVSYKGKKGQIVSILGNGDIILEVQGSTVECAPSEIKILTNRVDTVDAPYKFDMNTLKALYEQMVECGIFMNNVRISQPGCYVKYSDWKNAKDDDNLNILMLNESHLMQKKYIKILEDENAFANPDDYVEGVEVTEDGQAIRNVLININDYLAAEGGNNAIRVLVTTDNKKQLIMLPKDALKTLTI